MCVCVCRVWICLCVCVDMCVDVCVDVFVCVRALYVVSLIVCERLCVACMCERERVCACVWRGRGGGEVGEWFGVRVCVCIRLAWMSEVILQSTILATVYSSVMVFDRLLEVCKYCLNLKRFKLSDDRHTNTHTYSCMREHMHTQRAIGKRNTRSQISTHMISSHSYKHDSNKTHIIILRISSISWRRRWFSSSSVAASLCFSCITQDSLSIAAFGATQAKSEGVLDMAALRR